MKGKGSNPWIKLQQFKDSGSYRCYRLGKVKLRSALSKCAIYDVNIGDRIFESCHISIHASSDLYSDQTILAKTPDGVSINLNVGARLKARQEVYDAIKKKRKEKKKQEAVQFLIKIKEAVERKLVKLQSSSIADWNVKASLGFNSKVRDILK